MIMSTDRIKMQDLLQELIGSRMELGIADGLYKGNYASRLEDLSPSEDGLPLLGVAHPMFRGVLLPMARNLELTLRIEAVGCFYQGEAQIVRHVMNGRIPLLWLALEGPLERTQRRMFVRVPCRIKAQAYLLEVEPEGEDTVGEEGAPPPPPPESCWFPVVLQDISLGGVGVAVHRTEASYLRERGRYLLQVFIADSEFFLVCHLVKVFSVSEGGDIEAGMAYEGLPAFTEKLMGTFIRQQELSSRGV